MDLKGECGPNGRVLIEEQLRTWMASVDLKGGYGLEGFMGT